jgi:carboxylate-amine ligase
VIAAPSWSEWNPLGGERPWTVGVEEEALIVERGSGAPANRIGDVLLHLPADVAEWAAPETHACVIELATRPHATVADVAAELAGLRRRLSRALARHGLRAAVAGTHPFATWQDVQLAPGPRQQAIHASTRELARREPTCALHVHVAVPDGETAVRALAGLREDLPLLLALSANSPYWQGRDTGLASARTPIFSAFPRVGIPRHFESYADYVDAVDSLIAPGSIPDPSYVWWDVRLQPALGTVEVRVMDAQSRVRDVAALAALVQCLVRLHASTDPTGPRLSPEALDENRFLACRDGIRARLIAPERGGIRPVAEQVVLLLLRCRSLALELGCRAELDAVGSLATMPGDARQRAIGRRDGLVALTAALAAAYTGRRSEPAPHPSSHLGDALAGRV